MGVCVSANQYLQDNGILRMADVLSWTEVAIRPTSRTVLSFQRGYVPVLRVSITICRLCSTC